MNMFRIMVLGIGIQCICTHAESSRKEIFSHIYTNKVWALDNETCSGPGSKKIFVQGVMDKLPAVLERLGVKVLVDVGCGDLNWMQELQLTVDRYIGLDIVDELIADLTEKYSDGTSVTFKSFDIVEDALTCDADTVILLRSVLPSLSDKDIFAALKNIKKSGAKYLIATTYSTQKNNRNMACSIDEPFSAYPMNLQIAPYNFPEPLGLINEGLSVWPDKSLGIWKIESLPDYDLV